MCTTFSSKRARDLVALCKNNDVTATVSSSFKKCSVLGSRHECSPMSPISCWWDEIYEASDMYQKKQSLTLASRETVKRKLSFHATKSDFAFNAVAGWVDKTGNSQLMQLMPAVINPTPVQNVFTHNDLEGFPLISAGRQPLLEIDQDPVSVINNLDFEQATSQVQDPLQKACVDFILEENLFPSQAKTLQTKLALNSGMKHVNTVGKVREARKILRPCRENCIRCEKPKLNDDERNLVSKSFWNLKSHEQQWLFIHNVIRLSHTKRKLGLQGTIKGKAVSRNYSFLVNGKHRKVCKTMFKSTLNISDSWIVSALSHCVDNNLVIPDQRGKHRSLSSKK